MKLFSKFSTYLNESVALQLLKIIENNKRNEGNYILVETSDFIVKFNEVSGKHLSFNWCYMKTKKFSGTDILRALIMYSQKKGYRYISGYGIKGYDKAKIDGKYKDIKVNGFYTIMRWGFLPDKGVKFINKVLKSNYSSLEDAFSDSFFWQQWKEKGVEFYGEFDLSPNSLSFKVLNKEI